MKQIEKDVTILRMLASGVSFSAVAAHFGQHRQTINQRIDRLRRNAGARNIAHLVAMATLAWLIESVTDDAELAA